MTGRAFVWIAGSTLLMGLNLHKNVQRALDRYDWKPVTRTTLHRSISTQGVIEAFHVATLISAVDENVERKMAEEGTTVKKNQTLLELSRTRTKLDYDQRRNAEISAENDSAKAIREVTIQK